VFGYNGGMLPTWLLQPDGTYKRLSEREDLITELNSTLEDVHEAYWAVQDISLDIRAVQEQSRRLMEQSQRERRLRKTSLRLVRALA
jgi:hypothetical protein